MARLGWDAWRFAAKQCARRRRHARVAFGPHRQRVACKSDTARTVMTVVYVDHYHQLVGALLQFTRRRRGRPGISAASVYGPVAAVQF